MTIDEAIADAEETARQLEIQAQHVVNNPPYFNQAHSRGLKVLAANRRQIAAWLRELKESRKKKIA